MTENDEQEHKHVEDDCKRADIKTLHVLTSNRTNFMQNHPQDFADGFLLHLFKMLLGEKNLVHLFRAEVQDVLHREHFPK